MPLFLTQSKNELKNFHLAWSWLEGQRKNQINPIYYALIWKINVGKNHVTAVETFTKCRVEIFKT